MGLFELLAKESLTEARLIRYDGSLVGRSPPSPSGRGPEPVRDGSKDRFELSLLRTFDDGLDFRDYARTFLTDTLPVRSPISLADTAARALIEKHGAGDTLKQLESMMEAGRHEAVFLRFHRALDVRTALFVHSSRLGRNNGLHAIRAGGFRRHELNERELDVFADGLNLARAMSFKNAAADLPIGGCKMTVQCAPVALDDLSRLGFIAYAIDAGRFVTGPDMGFSPDHSDVIRAHFSRHTTGGRKGSMGPTGTPTALGTFLAIQEAAEFAFGARELFHKRAVVQGLGAVGLPLAVHLKKAGMRVAVTDPDPRAIERAREALGMIEVISPERATATPTDIFVPCAIGGILDRRTIESISTKMIYGSANNPLKAMSKSEEIELAALLAKRGILFQIEWTHNTAGVMAGFEEYVRGDEASIAHLVPRLERVCRDGTRKLLSDARDRGKTPTEVAYETMERKIYSDTL